MWSRFVFLYFQKVIGWSETKREIGRVSTPGDPFLKVFNFTQQLIRICGLRQESLSCI